MDFSYPPIKNKTLKPKQLKSKTRISYFRYGWQDNNILNWLKDNLHKYNNIVGVSSLMSSNWTGAYRLISMIKQINPKSSIVIGGPHATIFPDHVSKLSQADYICIGEGEDSFYKFIANKKQSSITKTKSKTKKEIKLFENLDLLPFPERSLLLDDRKTSQIYITFSRGCPHKCSFL